ncbi:uncharacterized protein VTP21DRAFT_5993 [Calcarisporiella thermophila]|uniref:uncharacterized protein n=1 Tax=Calcarisporiella thermophila TaxID=911321 RepID=UPI0037436F75
MLLSPGDLTINILSAICGFLMMVIVVWLRRTQPDVANTISFKLSFWIGLVDMLWRTEFIISKSDELLNPIAGRDHWVAHLFLWVISFLRLWAVLPTICIAIDLQLSFIHHRKDMKRIQRWYIPGMFIFTFLVTLIYLTRNKVMYDNVKFQFISNASPLNLILTKALCMTLWMSLSVLYSIVVVIMVLIRALQATRNLKRTLNISEEVRAEEMQLINSVLRIMLYPVVHIITLPSGIVLEWVTLTTTDPNFHILSKAREVDNILQGSIGILNFLVFLLNPALHRALKRFSWWPRRNKLKVGDVPKKTEEYDKELVVRVPGESGFV